MFLKTLPVVPISARTLALPASRAATSFFLPKIAEQGLGVPVRRIDGDYLHALRMRLKALLGHQNLSHILLSPQKHLLAGLCVDQKPHVQLIVPPGGVLKTDHEVDTATSEALIDLLPAKDQLDVELLGFSGFPDGVKVLLQSLHVPYLRLLYSLELTGVIRGILYDYDVFSAREIPSHADVRRIQVAPQKSFRRALGQLKRKMSLSNNGEILKILEQGREIDGDAGPLHDFFREAFKLIDQGHPEQISGLSCQANVFATDHPQGRPGRNQIASKTVVEARA